MSIITNECSQGVVLISSCIISIYYIYFSNNTANTKSKWKSMDTHFEQMQQMLIGPRHNFIYSIFIYLSFRKQHMGWHHHLWWCNYPQAAERSPRCLGLYVHVNFLPLTARNNPTPSQRFPPFQPQLQLPRRCFTTQYNMPFTMLVTHTSTTHITDGTDSTTFKLFYMICW